MNTFIANYPTLFAAFCGLGAMMVLAFGVWLVSVAKHDASIVDSVWSVMIFGAALAYALMASASDMAPRREWLPLAHPAESPARPARLP